MRKIAQYLMISLLVSVFVLPVACDGNNTDGNADSDADSDTDTDIDTDGDIDSDGDTDTDGDNDIDEDNDGIPGGPKIVSFATNSSSITEGENVLFTASVTHPDGEESISGGNLNTPDGLVTYGPFTSVGGGNYSVEIRWNQIHDVSPIVFEDQEIRTFQAHFHDLEGRSATRTVDLTLTCDGNVACDATCVDLRIDVINCGGCGNNCSIRDGIGGCESGACLPTLSECFDVSDFSTCEDYCSSIGESCAESSCGGRTLDIHVGWDLCEEYRQRATNSDPCTTIIPTDLGNIIRCCCTVTP